MHKRYSFDDLPPVGTIVAYMYEADSYDDNRPRPKVGQHVTVIGYHQFNPAWRPVVVYAWMGENLAGEATGYTGCITPSQLECLSDDYKDLAEIIRGTNIITGTFAEDIAEAVINAGYKR